MRQQQILVVLVAVVIAACGTTDPASSSSDEPPSTTRISATTTETPDVTAVPESGSTETGWSAYPAGSIGRDVVVDADGYVWAVGDAGAVRVDPDDLSYQVYTAEDGLADTFVLWAAAHPDGSVWFQTMSGASRFRDGAFDNDPWGPATPPWESGDTAYAQPDLAGIGPRGDVWFVGVGYCAVFDGSSWIEYPAPDWMREGSGGFSLGTDGSAWMVPWDELYRFNGETFERMGSPYETWRSWDLAADNAGGVWIAGSEPAHYDGKTWTEFPGTHGRRIALDETGGVWMVSEQLYHLVDGTWETHDSGGWSEAMAVRSASDVWLSHQSSSTIARFHDGEWSFIAIDELEALDGVWITVADGVGSIYGIGTHSGLIQRHDGSQWGNYGSVPSGWEMSIPVGDVERGLWLASEAGIVRSINQEWEVVVEADQYPDGSLSALRLTPGGEPVVATYTEETTVQVSVWNGSEFDTTDILPHLEYPFPVLHLAFGPDGEIWAATYGEIVQLTNGDVARLPPGDWYGNPIYGFAVDHDGAVWVAHPDGVDRYADGEWWSSFDDDGVDISSATGVDVAHDGTVWVSSDGAYSFDGTGWSKFTTADGVISRNLTGVTVAGDGCVWFTSDKSGLARFCPA